MRKRKTRGQCRPHLTGYIPILIFCTCSSTGNKRISGVAANRWGPLSHIDASIFLFPFSPQEGSRSVPRYRSILSRWRRPTKTAVKTRSSPSAYQSNVPTVRIPSCRLPRGCPSELFDHSTLSEGATVASVVIRTMLFKSVPLG